MDDVNERYEMPTSQTPPSESVSKTAIGGRDGAAVAPAREVVVQTGQVQTGQVQTDLVQTDLVQIRPPQAAVLQPLNLQPGILDQLQDAVFTTDLHGVITSFNQGAQRYSFGPRDRVDRSITDCFGIEPEEFLASRALALVFEKGRFEGKFLARTRSGKHVDVHLCLTLLRDSKAAPAGILGLSNELTGENPAAAAQGTVAGAIPLARREIDGTQFLIASPLMHKFMGMVDRVAGHTETVLITGETGTGKELVARTIHESSYRRKNGLIDINCAALPEHLVESELFGYEKGAFSGADSSKPGLFEMADKSTIFLDEIGELQPQIQVKLLRVLDGAPYYRLGGNRKITVDVRVVAATNQDLELAVKEGRFRKDLFHRLGQFQLRVPPLRERPEDISALARHFMSLKAADKVLTGDALTALQGASLAGKHTRTPESYRKTRDGREAPDHCGRCCDRTERRTCGESSRQWGSADGQSRQYGRADDYPRPRADRGTSRAGCGAVGNFPPHAQPQTPRV